MMHATELTDGQAGTGLRGDVAITGMAGIFPGAPDLETFWENITRKVDAVTNPPPEAWEVDTFYDPSSKANDRVYCQKGGYLGPLAYFSPLAHGVMPRAVQGGEPDQWLALEVARLALNDAGYGEDIPERERTAVILGKGTYLNRGNFSVVQHGTVVDQTLDIVRKLHPEFSAADLALLRAELKRDLPTFNADTVPGLIPNIIAGRIANRLDLMGPTYTVDAACASSLIAVDMAVRDLLSGTCDLALAGGAHVVTPVPVMMVFCQLGALSRRERIRPFDQEADGTILGEGVGMIVLKRLADALSAGDRIYAVIKGVGVASDGRGLSVTAPRLKGELTALRRAYERAGVDPATVGLIEAHGTGTPVGDATEVQALSELVGPRRRPDPSCALGSVKSNIGHLMPAAGIAALIKTALALYHRVLPPTLNVDQPNPHFELEKTPFYVNTELRPWVHRSSETPRRAGVNAFGFGGINAHVVVEEAPVEDPRHFSSRLRSWETEVLLLRGRSRDGLIEQARALAAFLEKAPSVPLRDLAFSLNVAHADTSGPMCLALVASSIQDVREKLDQALKKLADPQIEQIKTRDGVYWTAQPLNSAGTVAFLFPGEGSQYVNMLADLCIHFPEVRAQFDLIDRVFAEHDRNYVPSDYLFPPPAFTAEAHEAAETRIWQMEGAIEAVLTANRSLALLLDRLQIKPAALMGHSTGEYSAMLASGMIQAENEAELREFALSLNDLHYQSADNGGTPAAALLAVGGDPAVVASVIAESQGQLYIAMANCPHQTVIAGPEEAVGGAAEKLHAAGLITERLPFDRPYHTPLFQANALPLEPFFARWLSAKSRIPVYSCTSSAPFPADLVEARKIAVEHWLQPVAFAKTIEAMYDDGMRIFVEVGAKGNLTAFVDDILRGQPHLAVAANVKSRSGITQLNHMLGMLAAQGVPMDLSYLYASRSPVELPLRGAQHEIGLEQKEANRIKLATGWPRMTISDDTATRLRALSQAQLAPIQSTIAPAAPVATGMPGSLSTSVARTEEAPDLPPEGSSPAGVETQPASAPQAMASYMQTMDLFLTVQEQVMQAFLVGRRHTQTTDVDGGQPNAAADILASPPPAQIAAGNGAAHETGSTDGAIPAPEAAASVQPAVTPQLEPESVGRLSPQAIRDTLLQLVGARTGYPIEMLDLNLDLEASLGIDSIKRVEILGAFRQQTGLIPAGDMEELTSRRTLQEMIDFLVASTSTPPSEVAASPGVPARDNASAPGPSTRSNTTEVPALQPDQAPMHFIRNIMSLIAGQELVASYDLTLEKETFLHDHALGSRVSAIDSAATGLSIMPLTVSMELLAEGAAVLMPGLRLVGMRDIRAYRWISLESGHFSVEITARRLPDATDEVYACLREAQSSEQGGQQQSAPIIEGTMLFAETYPAAPIAAELVLEQEQPSEWTTEQLYQEGMFHGPLFQGVRSIDRTGRNGCEATLAVRPTKELFRSEEDQYLVTDPVLLDQPGQVVGFWTAEHLKSSYVIFPFSVQELRLYDCDLHGAGRVRCQARIELIGDFQVRSDLDIIDANGRVGVRFIGWEDRRFDLPETFFRFMLSPQQIVLSEPHADLARLLPAVTGLQAYGSSIDAFPSGFFTAHGGIWLRVLAHLILGPREQALWRTLTYPEKRRHEWLLGRLAAKDAVRAYLRGSCGIELCPADIEILPDQHGLPMADGIWRDYGCDAPHLSIAHSNGTAVAAVCAREAGLGLGVDIQEAGQMTEATVEMAFTPGERELLEAQGDLPSDEWPIRLWCAKEAAAKAIGRGMLGGPQSLEARALDPARGTIQITVTGALAEAVPEMNGRTLTVYTGRERDSILALSCLDATA